jgi:hypothetical protein
MSEKTELMEGQLWSLAQPDIRTNIRKMKLIFTRRKAQCFHEGGFTGSCKGLPEVGILKGFWDVQGVLESRKQTDIYKIYSCTNFCTVLLDACNTTLLLCNLSELQWSSCKLCVWSTSSLMRIDLHNPLSPRQLLTGFTSGETNHTRQYRRCPNLHILT